MLDRFEHAYRYMMGATNVEREPDPSPKKGDGLTTTQLLLGVIAVIGLAILYQVTRLPEGHPFKECERIIGMNSACEARVAASRMMRGF